jgi:hypothetical protein
MTTNNKFYEKSKAFTWLSSKLKKKKKYWILINIYIKSEDHVKFNKILNKIKKKKNFTS